MEEAAETENLFEWCSHLHIDEGGSKPFICLKNQIVYGILSTIDLAKSIAVEHLVAQWQGIDLLIQIDSVLNKASILNSTK